MSVFNDSVNPSQTDFTTSSGKLQLSASTALTFQADSGTATAAANTITITGGTNMSTTGSGSTVSVVLGTAAGGNPPDPHVPDSLFQRRMIVDEFWWDPGMTYTGEIPTRGLWQYIGTTRTSSSAGEIALKRGRVGVQAFETTASTSQGWYAIIPVAIGTQEMSFGWTVAFDVASGWGAGAYAYVGLNGTNPPTVTEPTVGAWFYFDPTYSANIICRTGDGATIEETDSGLAIDTSWRKLMIWANDTATAIEFFIDGSVVATHNTNLPADTESLRCTYAQYHSQAKMHFDTLYFLNESISL